MPTLDLVVGSPLRQQLLLPAQHGGERPEQRLLVVSCRNAAPALTDRTGSTQPDRHILHSAAVGPETDSHQTPQDLRFGRLQLPTEWNVLRLVGIQLSLGGAPVLYQPLLLDQWKEARISAHGA